MKRTNTQSSQGSGYGGGYNNKGPGGGQQPKKPRANFEDGPSFEDELVMMDEEFIAEQRVDVGEESASVQLQQKQKWIRTPPDSWNCKEKPLLIHWLDIDMYSGQPLTRNPDGVSSVPGSQEGPVPIIRFYGVTPEGHSVMCHVHGVTPYFYAQIAGLNEMSNEVAGNVRMTLDQRMRERARGDEKGLKTFVLGVEVQPAGQWQSIMGYHFNEPKLFLKIYVAMPSLVPSCKRLIDEGIHTSQGMSIRGQTFESNVPFVLRFMIDENIQGSDWIELPAGKYAHVADSVATSRCTLEVDVAYNNIVSHECTGIYSSIAPLRVCSFDIECGGRKGHFPDPQFDPVIQIANIVTVQGTETPIVRTVFTLNTCLPIVGAQVICSETEEEMLLKWRDFMLTIDPDILTGYNIANFDIPYLFNRAKALEKQFPSLKRFTDLSRVKGLKCTMKDTTFQSSAYGKRENVETTINGRIIFDLLPYMFRNHKLSSYSLNSVSAEFLNSQKEDVHHSMISELQAGSDADRRRLAVYCLKDAYLPWQLMCKLSILVNYIEMSRVTGVPLNFILLRGQQIKVFSMLLRKCKKSRMLIPHVNKAGAQDEGGYEGATVIDPKKAFYETPIATLDFASLYPSIMQAYNLCYSTLVHNQDLAKLSPDQYEKGPSGYVFVKGEHRRGILPEILDELLAARKRAKKDMANATDPMEKAVQNGRQLALKVSANSVYGFTGAAVGQLPCLPIASTVTAYGRQLLLQTKAFVEQRYTQENGFDHNAEVVYGDTDSVMIKFGYNTVAECMPLAQQAASEVSAIFPRPIKLEFEKVYWPYLLMNKKRYAGLLWTNPDKFDKLDAKGLETVRRDNCLLVRKVVDTCLKKLLIDRDVQGAVDFVKHTISDLLQNKMDISMLVISKALGRGSDDSDYAVKLAHVELAMRMRKRDPGSAPQVGDRVAYVIIQGAKGAPAYEKSEDPVYVLEQGLPIDTEYYLTNQLSNPLIRIFEPIIPNPQSLISGDHTRSVVKSTPKGKGGIMGFAVKKETCMGCRT
eukprot:gene34500-41770_t